LTEKKNLEVKAAHIPKIFNLVVDGLNRVELSVFYQIKEVGLLGHNTGIFIYSSN
jgi:hypothetical protein